MGERNRLEVICVTSRDTVAWGVSAGLMLTPPVTRGRNATPKEHPPIRSIEYCAGQRGTQWVKP